jgi:hypothetical protein
LAESNQKPQLQIRRVVDRAFSTEIPEICTLPRAVKMEIPNCNCLAIWIPATNMESLYQAYLDVARQLGIAGCEEEQADVKRLVQGYSRMQD